jgi:NADH-quinone oxidoreductase subunit A
MNEVSQISSFGKILLFIIIGFLFVGGTFLLNKLIAPHKPTPQKLSSYECGEEPIGSSWIPFNSRFYVIALIFLLFDVEMVFIFPWATVFAQESLIAADARWGWLALVEMFIFLFILILGLVYAWRKGDLEWIKSAPLKPTTDVKIPRDVYERVNNLTPVRRIFSMEQSLPELTTLTEKVPEAASQRKPMFKPTFKKNQNES